MADADTGYDLTEGVILADFGDANLLRGRVGDEDVVLARLANDEVVAIGATCSHYGGPLDQGIVVGETIRCPWHHACFALRTGEAVGAPAIEPVAAWTVERQGERYVVRGRASTEPAPVEAGERPGSVLIVGGGAAGFACAELLRRRGFAGAITIASADADAPYDRPKLSKDFLAGDAGGQDLPLKPASYYADAGIDLRLRTEITALDLDARTARAADGATFAFDTLVLATGAEPVRPPIDGADQPHVHYLRTVADSRALIDAGSTAGTAVVVGSGFIGLETAASLSQRGVRVHVVTEEDTPLGAVLGGPLGERVRAEHEANGTTFHTGASVSRIDTDAVILGDGARLDADLVVLGVGVTPRTSLARAAGLDVDDGVLVDQCLRASAPGVYAAGDVARWRDARADRTLRVEHWVLAERHGQHIARNILTGDAPFTDVPFFWSGHYDMKVRYVGHAEEWDEMEIDGDVAALDCVVRYKVGGETLAIATAGRDEAALAWEAEREGSAR